MTPTTVPTARLTAADLTLADVEALIGFIELKVSGLLAEHSPDSDAWKAVLGLRLALNYQAKRVREAYGRADYSIEMVQTRLRQWNRLTVLALGWATDAGYDERWKIVNHPDAEGAAIHAALMGRSLPAAPAYPGRARR
ncbi:hypothetical protein ACFWM0_06215 [Streptomyces sp. NPDC058405]|uniref:hypothetical protein n=1 Tax=unclassified Streptomyces TaxID=2593676 RepID=UPI0036583C1B